MGTMDIGALYHDERPRALATLIRLIGDFQLAEDALQEAFAVALTQWDATTVPSSPRAWLVSTARHKALDTLRRRKAFDAKRPRLAATLPSSVGPFEPDDDPFPDDRLRLIFTCCHPALAPEAQVALTLKTLCGLSVEEIARAFLVPPATMAQRLVRAKNKIRTAGIAYEVPDASRLTERLAPVLRALYLVFNEGYAATSGDAPVRRELCTEGIRLARLLAALLPDATEPAGLLALMLLQDSRRAARQDEHGEMVTLEVQDRARWDQASIAEGRALAERTLRRGGVGFYAIQAAIAALHAEAPRPEQTDWPQIAALYALLVRLHRSPVVELNHAVAVAMADGLERGLRLMDALDARGDLAGYHLLPAARADVLRRLGRAEEAARAYRQALELVTQDAERRYLERRLGEVSPPR